MSVRMQRAVITGNHPPLRNFSRQEVRKDPSINQKVAARGKAFHRLQPQIFRLIIKKIVDVMNISPVTAMP
jgi:hypothetical protein